MIGIDTNILVRFHIQDNEEQFTKAKELIDSATNANPVHIDNVVLVEWSWVLLRAYKVPKKKVIEEIEIFINAGDVLLEKQEICRKAVKAFKNSSADFTDCLIGALNKEHNCQTTYTFDKKASNLSSFTLLS